jgi:hypothetical protein
MCRTSDSVRGHGADAERVVRILIDSTIRDRDLTADQSGVHHDGLSGYAG